MSFMQHLDDPSFSSGIAQGITLVDFYADWCGPCKAMVPLLDGLAEELHGKATIAKVNVDDAQATAASFGITAIPTLILFHDGKEMKRFTGMTKKERLLEAINGLI